MSNILSQIKKKVLPAEQKKAGESEENWVEIDKDDALEEEQTFYHDLVKHEQAARSAGHEVRKLEKNNPRPAPDNGKAGKGKKT